MKHYLLQHGDGEDEDTLHEFDTLAERERATIQLIFGEDRSQDAGDAWVNYRAALMDNGCITFEGDPGLEWFTATPASSPNTHLSDPKVG